MSQYLPQAAVAKENMRQLIYRVRLEEKNKDAIKGFKELLKEKSTVLPAITAIGFTRKHAIALEMRLQFEIATDEELERQNAARLAKIAELEAEKTAKEKESSISHLTEPTESEPLPVADGKIEIPDTSILPEPPQS